MYFELSCQRRWFYILACKIVLSSFLGLRGIPFLDSKEATLWGIWTKLKLCRKLVKYSSEGTMPLFYPRFDFFVAAT
jgi:hypothetical protein